MANEIVHDVATGQTLYAVRWQLNKDVFLTDGASDEVWGTGGRDADDYDVTMTENAPDGHYVGDFDTSGNIADGVYQVVVFIQAGGSPADSDLVTARGQMHWDGSAELNLFTLNTQIKTDIIGADGDTLESLSDQIDTIQVPQQSVHNIFGPGE